MISLTRPIDSLNDRVFNAIYARSLIYNTYWEDPAVDRLALDIDARDEILVIASAGCNTLDYALAGPALIHAVDMNPRQIALLELKLAGIKGLSFEDFFLIFGTGRHAAFREVYGDALRARLSPFARAYWDRRGAVFLGGGRYRGGLYFHGLSGKVARAFQLYLSLNRELQAGVEAIVQARDMDEQREIFDSRCQPHMWSRQMNWLLASQFTMNMLGVPHPQRKEVEKQHLGGVAAFIRETIEYVFRQIPLSVNYFWRVYRMGTYSEACCPEYLRRENFMKLQAGLVDRIALYTGSVSDFLKQSEARISKFVLLDHMDWMSSYRPQALIAEWQLILARAARDARVIFRSAHAWPSYLDTLCVESEGGATRLLERLHFHPDLAAELQRQDRVHTYAGFHIADIRASGPRSARIPWATSQ